MATATRRRSSPARRARESTGGAARAAKGAGGKARKVADTVTPSPKQGLKGLARAAALKALKAMGRKALDTGAEALRAAADHTAAAGRHAFEAGMARRLPIQVAADVAVPVPVAWEEWMSLDCLTEGTHRIENVQRDGDLLVGRIAAPRGGEWEAEIVDERELQSFAWRSLEGSDCAGLVTFHRLSDRLTRVELGIDVLPAGPADTLALSLHLAHHRARVELRRFKARVEFIDPDEYENDDAESGDARRNGGAPDNDSDA
jgi:uncharacterized membrane protein